MRYTWLEVDRPNQGFDDDGHDHEWLSVCCGAREHSEVPDMCGHCKEMVTFKCNCGRERSETDD